MLCDNKPLREHLTSFLKVLGKFSLGVIVFGGGFWLAGNAFIDSLAQPILATVSSLSPKEMVLGISICCGLAGGFTSAIYFSSSRN